MEPPVSDLRRLGDALRLPGQPPNLQAVGRGGTAASLRTGTGRTEFHRISNDDLAQRLRANKALLTAAEAHLEWVSMLLGEVTHAVSLADADGILLRTIGNWPDLYERGLQPGYDWSEAKMGVNGPGTAIAQDQSIAIAAPGPAEDDCPDCIDTAAPIHDLSGRVIGAINISTPADQTHAERLLLAAHIALLIEQALHASARAAQAEAVRLLALLSGFTAHELANPLAALKTMLDLLSRASLDKEAARMVAAAGRNAERLLQVVEELRVLGGSHDRHLRRTDLRDLLDSALSASGLVGRIETDIALPAARLAIDCNPALLCRALDNLLRNAHDAVETGGAMGVRLQDAGSAVRIVVWDTGTGVAAEHRHRLLQESFTTKLGGSGLGLLLAKAIVEQVHDGRLRYVPNRPRGSRFEIELPLS